MKIRYSWINVIECKLLTETSLMTKNSSTYRYNFKLNSNEWKRQKYLNFWRLFKLGLNLKLCWKKSKFKRTIFKKNQRRTRDIMKPCSLIRNFFPTHIRSDSLFEWIRVLVLVSFCCINSSINWLITDLPRYYWLRFSAQCDTSRYFFGCARFKVLWKSFHATFRWTTWKLI